MTEGQSTTPAASGRNRNIGIFLAIYVTAMFLWRMFTPAHEYPMRTEQVMEIVIDIMCVVGLIGVRPKIPVLLFWVGITAGVGLLAIRLHSDASWWTGHFDYSLLPR